MASKSDVFVQVSDYKEDRLDTRQYTLGRTTVVELIRHGKVFGTGVAVRNPQDPDDPELGFTIAAERAAFDMYRTLRKLRTRMQHA